jgi:hypothetical protein
VAVGVVDLLEPIHVNEGEIDFRPGAPATLKFVRQSVFETSVVQKSGEAIAVHHRAQGNGAFSPHPHERDKPTGIDGLRNEVVTPKLSGSHLLRRILLCRKKDNRQREKAARLSDYLGDLDTLAPGI